MNWNGRWRRVSTGADDRAETRDPASGPVVAHSSRELTSNASTPRRSPAAPPERRARPPSRRPAIFLALLVAIGPRLPAADVAHRTLLLDVASAGGALIAVGERGTILRSEDKARTWKSVDAPAAATMTGVSFADDRAGWVVGHDALILASADAGRSWSRQWQGENLADSLLDVLAIDPQHVIAVGAYGLYLSSGDGGRTWRRQKVLTEDFHLNRISRGPTGTLYLAGEHGTLLRSRDGGANWTAIPTSYEGSFYGVLPLGPARLLVYGLRGRVFLSDNDGADWQPISTNEPSLLASAVRLPTGEVVLVGQARALLVSADLRHGFVRREETIATGIAELTILSADEILAVGEAGVTVIGTTELRLASKEKAP